MKISVIAWISSFSFVCFFSGLSTNAFAASGGTVHAVTLSVPIVNQFQADTQNFTLTFSDFIPGSVSDTRVVTYSVKANNVSKSAGVIQAQISGLPEGVDLQANPGAYIKRGGNASLRPATSDFFALASAIATLYNRITDSGDGKVLLGSFPVAFRANARSYLSAMTVTPALTVTFTDT
jgi:hypothetical protein